jgi:hypothetical protein
MKEQLIEMGFYPGRTKHIVYYGFDDGTLWVDVKHKTVAFEDTQNRSVLLANNATIEQISNILKSIQI